MDRPLLAKSIRRDREPVTLQAHSLDTETAASILFDRSSRLGRSFVRFFGLPDDAEHERFLLHLRLAALFHDIGKANEDFQAAVRAPSVCEQAVRHEHLSALVLCLPEVRRWLSSTAAIDADVVTGAVLSHHFKAGQSGEWQWCQPRQRRSVRLHLDGTDVRALLERVAEVASVGAAPALPVTPWGDVEPWSTAWSHGRRAAVAFRRTLDERGTLTSRGRLLIATKAALVCADAASSGLVREGHPLEAWLNDIAARPGLSPEAVRDHIIAPRGREITALTGRPFDLHAFQREVATRGPRVLLVAACASGKTLAAWNWASERLSCESLGRVIFLYPTRGTATEGFRDYVSWAPAAETALLHGTARYELAAMARNPADCVRGRLPIVDEADERLFALAYWGRRWFSATVDQFLGFLEHQYGSACLLPALADAALIVDEVHSFDQRLFNDFVAFLRTFRGPVLAMTATLPPSRRAELQAAGLVIYPGAADRELLADLERAESAPRYRVYRLDDTDELLRLATEGARSGKRVLWVTNTVARCQERQARLQAILGEPVLAYHSRYRLIDRQRVHAEVVGAFGLRRRDEHAIAVTTQVCEMSLDLDADLLITELAPPPALIQRMGRANRHLSADASRRADVYACRPASAAPYLATELDACERMLDDLIGADISQRDLASALERCSPLAVAGDATSRFLESGYYATPGSLRNEDDFAVPALLDADVTALDARRTGKHELDGYVVAVPRKDVDPTRDRPPWLPQWLAIAPAARYDPHRGFLAADTEVA